MQALIGWATPHMVTGGGQAAPTRLLYSNFSEPPRPPQPAVPAADSDVARVDMADAGLSAGSIAAIAVPTALGGYEGGMRRLAWGQHALAVAAACHTARLAFRVFRVTQCKVAGHSWLSLLCLRPLQWRCWQQLS